MLLHMHKKHHNWFGLGGHVEGNENPVEAVIREAKEEAGIDVTIVSAHPLHTFTYANELIAPVFLMDQDIDGDHRHTDCIYFGTTPDPSKVTMKEPFKWFSKKDLEKGDIQEDTKYIANAALIML